MAESVSYRLSSVDNSIIRTYSRLCLCFPCDSEQFEVQRIVKELNASIERAVSFMPILAGTVVLEFKTTPTHPPALSDGNSFAILNNATRRKSIVSTGSDNDSQHQGGRLVVQLTLDDISMLKPSVSHPSKQEFPHTYDELADEGMSAAAFIGDSFTPLPDMPDPARGGNPVFAVQASFIEGGVIVAFYVHHSVMDIHGLSRVIRIMSISEEMLPTRQLNMQVLRDDALEQSRVRDRLSGSRGYKADFSEHPEYDTLRNRNRRESVSSLAPSNGIGHILSFDLKKLEATRDIVNERFHYIQEKPNIHVSVLDCLAAILWKGITRAHWLAGAIESGQTSSLLMPVNIRKKMEPPLDDNYYGNARLFSHSAVPVPRLGLAFDVSTIAQAAHLIRTSNTSLTDAKVRSAIAIINDRDDVRSVNHPAINFDNDVFISNWSALPGGEEATLGLGLGSPQFVRKPSRQQSSYGCILLPQKKDEGVWEVLIQMTEDTMARLLEDPGLSPFVLNVA